MYDYDDTPKVISKEEVDVMVGGLDKWVGLFTYPTEPSRSLYAFPTPDGKLDEPYSNGCGLHTKWDGTNVGDYLEKELGKYWDMFSHLVEHMETRISKLEKELVGMEVNN